MNNQEILDMCRRLASKYYNHQDYDDIVSEGVVLCLNMRAEGIKEPFKLYYSARTAMYEFVNVGMSKLSYPKGRSGRVASDDDVFEYVDAQEEQIPAEDLFGSYELKDSIEVLKKELSAKEWRLFMVLYNNNNNLTEASKVLNVSRQAVEQIRNNIRYKLVTICDLAI
jgi:DNA-directed RNA polymerase specialized sigma24 family protein